MAELEKVCLVFLFTAARVHCNPSDSQVCNLMRAFLRAPPPRSARCACVAPARALAPRLAAFFQKRFKAGRMPRPTRPSSIMALPSTTGDPHPDTRGGVGGPTGPRRWPREPRHRLSAIMGPPLYDATKQHDRASCA